MKVKEIEHSVTSYDRTLRIEREGEVHHVIVHWDNTDGYECYWLNSEHRFQETPKWALELEEENEDGDSLGWILEVMADTTAITERIRTYELEKVETYTIRATSEESAIEILNGLDNSSASRVEIRSVFASAPEASV